MAYLLVSARRSASVFMCQFVQRLKTQTKKIYTECFDSYIINKKTKK